MKDGAEIIKSSSIMSGACLPDGRLKSFPVCVIEVMCVAEIYNKLYTLFSRVFT